MKTIYIIICMIGLLSCNTVKEKQQNHLILHKAMVQTWYGGQEGVQGKLYTLTISSQLKDSITFDALFIEDTWHPVQVRDNNPWTITTSITLPNVEQPALDSTALEGFRNADIDVRIIKPNEQSNDFQGKNVLRYRLNGKDYYFFIDKFERSETLSYP